MRIDPDKPLFPISTVAEILECPKKLLRVYEKSELVRPARSDGHRRLYSQRDIERLEIIHYLTHVRRVNFAGVKVILELLQSYFAEDQWERLVKGVEQAVESLPAARRKVLEEGHDEVFEEFERATDDSEAVDDEPL